MITPIIFNPIENNPYFWWNGLEIPIQLKYLFEQVQKHDITIKELVDAVNKFNEEFEETIKQEVVDKINEMYTSGELSQIIGQAIQNSLVGKNGDFDLSHMGYILHKAHSYGVSELPAEGASLTIQEELYSALQGNCVFDINGNLFWACCYVVQNGSTFLTNNACRLYVYTINQDGSLSYVTDREIAAIGHCNGMGYNDGYLYITSNSIAGTGGGATKNVARISFDGENLGGVWSETYNKYVPEIKTPDGVEGSYTDFACGYDNKLYFVDSNMSLYEYDWSTNVATKVIDRMNGDEGYTGDGLAVTEHFVYMGAKGYRIKRYNKALGVIDWVYQLPTKPNNKAFKLGEVEGFSVVNGVLYVAGFYNLAGTSVSSNTYSITHFYRQNLANNNIAIPNFVNWSSGYTMQQATFTVEGALPSDTANPRNDYFSCGCVQVALDFLESNDYLQRAYIKVYQYRNLSTITIRTTKPVIISGDAYTSNTGTCPSIGHIYMLAIANVIIENINVSNRLPADINDGNITDNCIFNNGGCLTVKNCVFPTGLISNSSTVRFAIKSYNSVVNNKTNESYSTSPEAWVNNRTALNVYNPAYIAGTYSIHNINGELTGV